MSTFTLINIDVQKYKLLLTFTFFKLIFTRICVSAKRMPVALAWQSRVRAPTVTRRTPCFSATASSLRYCILSENRTWYEVKAHYRGHASYHEPRIYGVTLVLRSGCLPCGNVRALHVPHWGPIVAIPSKHKPCSLFSQLARRIKRIVVTRKVAAIRQNSLISCNAEMSLVLSLLIQIHLMHEHNNEA